MRIGFRSMCVGALVVLASLAPASAQRPQSDSLAGQLLVAKPELSDPRFAETVIFMVSHSSDGAMGLVVNRAGAKIPFSVLLQGFGLDAPGVTGDTAAHSGGPVERRRGFILHSTDVVDPSSVIVDDKLAMTKGAEFLLRIARGEGPADFLFLFGYAGWAPGQLEKEFDRGGWFAIPFDPALVFGDAPETAWQRAIDQQGVDL